MSTRPDPAKLRAGDPEATAAFVELLWNHARAFFKRESQLHDVVHDALLELLAKLERGDEPKHPDYWALNAANNAVRRELTRLKHQAIEYESDLHGHASCDAEALLDAREELRRINELLVDCDDAPSRALAGAAAGRDHREIAEELGISPGAARMTLARARAELGDRVDSKKKKQHLLALAQRAGLVECPSSSLDS